ncbi:hypothetical protein RF679_15240 [Undibacterium cyanobacteriorum]|uniref:Outer membrane protein beta-barrel domain-containing protein n=1 Tax=Undibacterium cyanobacteriorum TaxID=3073561 RepID=A0ABY9RFI0_9BURK|nr:DUF6588 family protein [Undibacterium sp. 20NA77.5]WMW79986.1 hypothetical protein RF679_15240 [Undibacterium sp. 20NA77.5]
MNISLFSPCRLALLSAFGLSMIASSASAATDFKNLKNLNQSEFNQLAKDFSAAGSYKAITPATPLGITGFDLGAEVSFTSLNNNQVWQKAGADISTLPMPKLHITKGLPFNIDVGASMVSVPDSDIKLMGFEARYALLEGSAATPALGVRAAYSKLSGVDQLDFNSKSLELVVSKGFLMVTPYAGVGRVWGKVTPRVGSLQAQSPTASKVFAGVNANFGLFNVAGELDRIESNQTVSVKLGFRW